MVEPVRIRARHRSGLTDVTLLAPHPMETGLRKSPQGTIVPAHFITDLFVTVAGRRVLEARMTFAMAADPLISFRFKGGRSGEPIEVTWIDNRGERRSDTSTIA